MVAGGVQSIEGGPYEGYSPQHTYYQQFYTSLLQGDSPVVRHPKCTCPVPPPPKNLSLSTPTITHLSSPRRPKCTCPSPPPSYTPSPGSSPPSSPHPFTPISWSASHPSFLSQPTFRHPKCTCPAPPPLMSLKPGLQSHCHDTGQDDDEPIYANTVRKSKKLVRAVLLDGPDNTPILGINRQIVRLHHSPNSVTTSISPTPSPLMTNEKGDSPTKSSPILVHRQQTGSPPITPATSNNSLFQPFPDLMITVDGHRSNNARVKKARDVSSPDDVIVPCGSVNLSPPHTPGSSPARKVKEKLSNFRQKVVSSLTKSNQPRISESDDTGGFEDPVIVAGIVSNGEIRGITSLESEQNPSSARKGSSQSLKRLLPSNVVSKILPRSSSNCRNDQSEKYGRTRSNPSFRLEDLPSPILNDLTSPIGSVPPLSPPSEGSSLTLTVTPPQPSPSVIVSSYTNTSTTLFPEVSDRCSTLPLSASDASRKHVPINRLSNAVDTNRSPFNKDLRRVQNGNDPMSTLPIAGRFSNSRRLIGKRKSSLSFNASSMSLNTSIDLTNFENHSQSLINVSSIPEVENILNGLLKAAQQSRSVQQKSRSKLSSSAAVNRRSFSMTPNDYDARVVSNGITSRSPRRNNSGRRANSRYTSTQSLAQSPTGSRPNSRASLISVVPAESKRGSRSDSPSSPGDTPKRKPLDIADQVSGLSTEDLHLLIKILEESRDYNKRLAENSSLYRARSLDVKDLACQPRPDAAKFSGESTIASTSHQPTAQQLVPSSCTKMASLHPSKPRMAGVGKPSSLAIQGRNSSAQTLDRSKLLHPGFAKLVKVEPPMVNSSLPRSKGQSHLQTKCKNVVFFETGDYIMLSKQIMDQWKLPYEFTYPTLTPTVPTTHPNTNSLSRHDTLQVPNDAPLSCAGTTNRSSVSLLTPKVVESSNSGSSTPCSPSRLELAEKNARGPDVDPSIRLTITGNETFSFIK